MSVTALLVQGSCITYHYIPFNHRVVTVIYLVQIKAKNGFETERKGINSVDIYPSPPRLYVPRSKEGTGLARLLGES